MRRTAIEIVVAIVGLLCLGTTESGWLASEAERFYFESCRTRDHLPYTNPRCEPLDADHDSDIDLDDWAAIQKHPPTAPRVVILEVIMTEQEWNSPVCQIDPTTCVIKRWMRDHQ